MTVRNSIKTIQNIMRQDTGVDGDAQRISQLCWMFFLKIIDDQDQQLELLQPGYRSPVPTDLRWRAWAADAEGLTGEALLAFINTELFPGLKNLTVTGKDAGRRKVVRDVFEDAYNYMKSGQLVRQVVNKINEVDFNNLAERQHFGDIYEQLLADLQSAGNAGEYYTPRAVTAFMADRIDPKPGEILLDPACGTGGFLTNAIRQMRERYVKTVADEQLMQQGLRAVEKKPLPHMLCVTNMLLHGIEEPGFVRHDNTLARPYVSYATSDRVDIVLTNPPFGGQEEPGIESNFPEHFRTRETADLFLALIIRLLRADGGRAAVVLPDGSLFGEGMKTRLKEHLMAECNLHTIVRLPNSVFKPYASIGTNLLFFEKGTPTKDIWFYEHRVPDGQKAYSMTKPIRVEHFAGCVAWWGGTERHERVETDVAWKVSAEDLIARGYNLDVKNPHVVADDAGDPVALLGQVDAAEREVAALKDKLKAVLAEALCVSDNALLSRLSTILDSPDSMTGMRRLVVGLALADKLGAVRFTRDDAGLLRRRWELSREAAKVAGKHSPSAVASLSAADLPAPFTDPTRFVRLGQVARLQKGLTGIKAALPGRFPLVVTAAARASCDHYDFDGAAAVVPMVSSTGHGDASIQRLHYVEGQFALGSILCAVFPIDPDLLSPRFLFEYLTAFKNELLVSRMIGTANVSLTLAKIADVPVPILPMASQVNVDRAMSLCAEIEAVQVERERRRDRLAATTLRRLIRPAIDASEFDLQAAARFYITQLDRIVARPEQLAAVRRAILDLGVTGRLVKHELLAGEWFHALSDDRRRVLREVELQRHPESETTNIVGLGRNIPPHWTHLRLGDLMYSCKTGYGDDPGPGLVNLDVVKVGNIDNSGMFVKSFGLRGFAKREVADLVARQNDIIVVKSSGSAENVHSGKAGLCGEEHAGRLVATNFTLRLRLFSELIDPRFMWRLINSQLARDWVAAAVQTLTYPNLTWTALAQMPVAVPPLAEQRRIAVKIDELMAACDQLESALASRPGLARRALDAVLNAALVAA